MRSVTFRVGCSVWAADGVEFAAGVHTVSKPDESLLRCLAGAAAASEYLEIIEATGFEFDPAVHVQSQDDGVAAYEAAHAAGAWHEGQALQAALDAANPDAPKAAI